MGRYVDFEMMCSMFEYFPNENNFFLKNQGEGKAVKLLS